MGTATLMSTQNADNVAVTGGTISGVTTTGGTITVQMAQNTSDASNTIALAGGWFQINRIA